jgi:alkaline phosphatase D
MHRRHLLGITTAGALAPAFLRHARAADVSRFALGVASGQPQPQGMVLWTRLTGPELPEMVDVAWELAEDEAFSRITARGTEQAVAADAHCVHAEPAGLQPARVYWYRFIALGQRSASGRTRTAPAPDAVVQQLDFAIASCQRYDVGHYAAWDHAAREELDLLVFLGDYIYEYPTARNAVRPHKGGQVVLLDDYRNRYAQYKSDPALQAAHAACPWLVVWDDHEVDNDYAGVQGQRLQPAFTAQRAAAYQAWWEHMPVPKAWRPLDGALRIYGSVDWGRLARFHLLDDRQYRDPQACPREGRGGSHTLPLADCAALADPKRTLLGARQEQWLAGNWSLQRPWNLLAQQTLMTRFSWSDPASSQTPGGTFWTDGWDGYAPARQRLLDVVARQQVPGVVVLGGDVHANYVADLKADFENPRAPVCATEFCGTSISSLGLAQDRVDAARAFNPLVHHARTDQRGYVRFRIRPRQLQAALQVVADARQPSSPLQTQARFVVDADKPGAVRA